MKKQRWCGVRNAGLALTFILAFSVSSRAQSPTCSAQWMRNSCEAGGKPRCDAARACQSRVLESWTSDRCMSSPARAQEQIAASCERCNAECGSEETLWMQGTWEGTGYQAGTKSSWSMRLVVSGDSFSISYPSLSCSGYWSLNRTGPGTANFTEHITRGADKCVDGGSVTVGNFGQSRMQFRWSSSDDSATATLTRK